MKRHRPNAVFIRNFHCPVCHSIMVAPKVRNNSEKGHRKNMYCFVCGEERKFIMDDNTMIRI